MCKFADAVVSNIEDKFPDLPIWSALKIYDPWPVRTLTKQQLR